MRDKPKYDINSGDSDKVEPIVTPILKNPTEEMPAQEASCTEQPVKNGEQPKLTEKPSQSPRFDKEVPFRIKDQFDDLDAIPPTLIRNAARPSKIQGPGAGLAETAQPGRTIRKANDFQDFFRNLDLIKIVRGVYRKFWIVLLAAFGMMILLLPVAHSLQGGAKWSSSSVIIYTKPTQKQIDTQGSSFLLRPLTQDTLVDMFLSPSHIRALEDAIGVKPLQKKASFESQSKSDIVTLRISDMPTEKTAIDAVNKLSEIIIANNDLYYRQIASAAYDQYKIQREIAEQNFNEAVKAVEAFQLKNQLLELNTQYQSYFSAVNAASERLSIAQVAHEGLVVRIKNYEKMIADLPDEVLNEALEDNPLKRRISNAEAALLDARIQYAADNPKILRQEREIEELRKLLKSGSYDETRERTYLKNPLKGQLEGELLKLRSEEDVAAQQEIALKKDFAALQLKFQDLPRLEKEYGALLEKRAQTDTALKSLKASEESARLTMQASLSDFKLISPAVSAEATAASLIGKIIPLVGFIFGFFGGLILVLIIELLDAKIRTQQQLENAYDAPCLASIIEIPRLEDYDTYQLLLPSLREISERLNVVLQGHRVKALGFFSSLNGEGKSILSFNLARYYSSLNIKVLFVGFDASPNPCISVPAEAGWPQKGIEDYLRGETELTDMVLNINGVDVIRVQESGSDLLDLAKGAAMPRLWDMIRQNYDLIITESPAVLDHPLSGTVAGFQDEIIYVLASSVSDRRLVDAGLEFLEDRGLAPRAVIFNRVDPYYLEDVRQQRIIRNLAERRTPMEDLLARFQPLADLFTRFRRPARTDQTPDEGTSISEIDGDIDTEFSEDEDLPEFIGVEDSTELSEIAAEEKEPSDTLQNESLPEPVAEEVVEEVAGETVEKVSEEEAPEFEPLEDKIPIQQPSGRQTPLARLLALFRRPAKENVESGNIKAPDEVSDTTDLPESKNEQPETGKESDEISFKDWLGKTDNRPAGKPDKGSENDEK
jgi:Mrp family chromosome partitioning ATPase/uncharacterized protein involved in exopolysaccharide biosynthesis